MKLFIHNQVDKQSLIGDIKTEYNSSIKQAGTDSDDFLISGTDKKEFQLLPFNGFSFDILENLPVSAKLKYLHIDIIDVNDLDNPGAINHKFNLTINDFDFKQLSRFELCNIDDSLDLTSITIDQITISEEHAANLIIYVAYYIPAIGTTTTSTTLAPTTTTTTITPTTTTTTQAMDADVVTYISPTYTEIENPTLINKIEVFVDQLKQSGLWNKMIAIYILKADKASNSFRQIQQSFNLRDVTTFQLDWKDGWINSLTSITGGGGTSEINTHIIPATHLDSDSLHISLHTTGEISTLPDIVSGPDGTSILSIFGNFGTSPTISTLGIIGDAYNYVDNRISGGATTYTSALITLSVTSSNLSKLYFNDTVIGTNTDPKTGFSDLNTHTESIKIGNGNSKTYSFISVGYGLNDSDVIDLNSYVNQLLS